MTAGLISLACKRTPNAQPAAPSYVSPNLCGGCHAAIARTYAQTGMGRSFYDATPDQMGHVGQGTTLDHRTSNRRYHLSRRGDRYFLKRSQSGFGGVESNAAELEIHYVMGSGNHSRSYLHRTAQGRIHELPVAWYSENGGTFAMSPGYDRPDHYDLKRQVTRDCMFCHNAYPRIPPETDRPGVDAHFDAPLPQGIDCQRCHGPGSRHVAAAQAKTQDPAAIRKAIVNPARLAPDREFEICLSCHLETTSFALPNSVVRYDRGAFSHRPGEPLEDFVLHFDHAPGTGRDGKFEIVHAAYRLRQSACYLKSGKLRCTSCHNPHDVPRGADAATHYAAACRSCHASLAAGHPNGPDCASCHMPKRRTEDVVHAVMTDHRIERRPPANLTAPRPEKHEMGALAYRGPVVLYYPASLPSSPERDLYLASVQVKQHSNAAQGLARLESAIRQYQPARPEFYFDLGQAYLAANRLADAVGQYQEALRRDRSFQPARRSLGAALIAADRGSEAIPILEQGRRSTPCDATLIHELARALLRAARPADAIAAAREAIACDPRFAEAHNTLGGVLFEQGKAADTAASIDEALRLDPDLAAAHLNKGVLLQTSGNLAEGEYHYRAAIRLKPNDAPAHYSLGTLLAQRDQNVAARAEFEAALRLSPNLAAAREMLGNLAEQAGDAIGAERHYRAAIRLDPRFIRAHLGLGIVLAAKGDAAGARAHLQRAAAVPGPHQEEARRALTELGR